MVSLMVTNDDVVFATVTTACLDGRLVMALALKFESCEAITFCTIGLFLTIEV